MDSSAAARRLGVGRQRVYDLIASGRLAAKRVGRTWEISEEAVAACQELRYQRLDVIRRQTTERQLRPNPPTKVTHRATRLAIMLALEEAGYDLDTEQLSVIFGVCRRSTQRDVASLVKLRQALAYYRQRAQQIIEADAEARIV